MPTEHDTMILVRWTGPFTYEAACEQKGAGLYLCWGQRRLGRPANEHRLAYWGISDGQHGVGARIRQHEGKAFANPENEWWIGRVILPRDATRSHLELAEWMLVYFAPSLYNEKKAKSPPKHHVYLVNEWYTVHDVRRKRLDGVCGEIADVIGWDPETDQLSVAHRLKVIED